MAEDHKERVDRELIELLNEIRVVLPGAQVLFAFLLTLPFAQRFGSLTGLDRDAYFAAFLCTAVGTSMLMAPSMNHRLRFASTTRSACCSGSTADRGGSAFLAAAIALPCTS